MKMITIHRNHLGHISSIAFLNELQLTLFNIVPWITFDLSKIASKTFPLN